MRPLNFVLNPLARTDLTDYYNYADIESRENRQGEKNSPPTSPPLNRSLAAPVFVFGSMQ